MSSNMFSTLSKQGPKKKLERATLAFAATAMTVTSWKDGSPTCPSCAADATVKAFDGEEATRASQWSWASLMGQAGLWKQATCPSVLAI